MQWKLTRVPAAAAAGTLVSFDCTKVVKAVQVVNVVKVVRVAKIAEVVEAVTVVEAQDPSG